jgi:ABC-type glycerol-3-phosphate transport system permease component
VREREPGTRRRRSRAKTAWLLLRYGVVLLLVIFAVAPLYWIIITAVRPTTELMQAPPSWLPGRISLSAFADVWSSISLAHYMLNSAIVAAVTTVIAVGISGLSGYALCRFEFRGNTAAFVLILFTQAIPGVIILVPFYLLLNNLGLINTRIGLSLSYVVWSVPFCTLLLRSYFKTAYPVELEDAAYIDGCSRRSVLWHIVFPLTLPGLAAAAVFVCLLSWNEYIWASVIATDESVRTVSFGLNQFVNEFAATPLIGPWMAGAVFTTLPLLLLYVVLQRYANTTYGGALIK